MSDSAKMGDVVVTCAENAWSVGTAFTDSRVAIVSDMNVLMCGVCGDNPRTALRYVDGVPKCPRCAHTYSEPVGARVMRIEREVAELRAFMVAGTNVNEVFAAHQGVQPTTQVAQAETKEALAAAKAARSKAFDDKAQRAGAGPKLVAWVSIVGSADVDIAYAATARLAIVESETGHGSTLATWSARSVASAAMQVARALTQYDIDGVYGASNMSDRVRAEFKANGISFHGVDRGAGTVDKAVVAAMSMCDVAEQRAAAAMAERQAAITAKYEAADVLAKLTQMTAEHRESRCYTAGYAVHDIGHAPEVLPSLTSLAWAGAVLPPDPPRYGWRLATADKAPAQPLTEGTPVYLAANGKDGTTAPGGTPVGYAIADGGMTVYPRGTPSASTPQAFVKVPASVPADNEVIGEPRRWTDAEVVAIAAAFGAALADETDAEAVNRIGYAFGWERDRMDALRKLLDVPCEPQAPLSIAPAVAIAGRVWAWLTRCDRDDGYNAYDIANGIGAPLPDVEKSLRDLCAMGRAVNLNPNAENFTEDDASRYRALAPAAGHVIGVEMGDAPVMPAPPQQDATAAALALALLATGRATAPQSVAATMAADVAAKQASEAPAHRDDTSQIKPPSLLTEEARRCLAGVAVYADSFNWCNERRLADGLAMKHSIVGQHLWLLLRATLVERALIGDDGCAKHVCWRLTDAGRATLATMPS